jgi:hypothetical protein|nr:MAG TPA: hypothetical protein [Caudoviricetes sp.]
MTMRKIFNLSEVDLSVPEGSLISISVAHSAPVRPNTLEMTALGVLVSKHTDGKVVKPLRVAPYNYEDIYFIDGSGERLLISREEADKPDAKYAIVPFRFVMTDRRRAFAKNIVIVDNTELHDPYIIVDSLAVGSDPNFIPIAATSILGLDLAEYISNI